MQILKCCVLSMGHELGSQQPLQVEGHDPFPNLKCSLKVHQEDTSALCAIPGTKNYLSPETVHKRNSRCGEQRPQQHPNGWEVSPQHLLLH